MTFEQRPKEDGRARHADIQEKETQTEEATSAKALRWKRESVCLQRSMRGENGRGRHQRSNDRSDHIKPCELEEGLALSLSEMEQH